jgi:hypothetical protein
MIFFFAKGGFWVPDRARGTTAGRWRALVLKLVVGDP